MRASSQLERNLGLLLRLGALQNIRFETERMHSRTSRSLFAICHAIVDDYIDEGRTV
jgi:hypothetical protein